MVVNRTAGQSPWECTDCRIMLIDDEMEMIRGRSLSTAYDREGLFVWAYSSNQLYGHRLRSICSQCRGLSLKGHLHKACGGVGPCP
jgi:hypothetical protein